MTAEILGWNALDILFTFGLLAYFTGTLQTCLNRASRIDPWASAAYCILTACFCVGNWHLDLIVSSFVNGLSVFAWAFIFFKRRA